MGKAKYLLLIVFAFILGSCKTKQFYSREISFIKDTVRLTRKERVILPVHIRTVIESPCDSLGVLKSFQAKILVPSGKVEIKSKGKDIIATVDIDSIVSVYEEKLRSSHSGTDKVSEKVITKEKIPPWAIITIIIETFLIIFYIYVKVIKPM
jgi:hypothetical protein